MKIKKIEKVEGRVKACFKYKISLDNSEDYVIDLNHEIYLNDGKVAFKKRQGWDYNRWPFSHVVIDFEIRSSSSYKIWDDLNAEFEKQQEIWKQKEVKNFEV